MCKYHIIFVWKIWLLFTFFSQFRCLIIFWWSFSLMFRFVLFSMPPPIFDVTWHGASSSQYHHAHTQVFMHRCAVYCHPCFACTSCLQHVNECPWCLSTSAAPESQTFDCGCSTHVMHVLWNECQWLYDLLQRYRHTWRECDMNHLLTNRLLLVI